MAFAFYVLCPNGATGGSLVGGEQPCRCPERLGRHAGDPPLGRPHARQGVGSPWRLSRGRRRPGDSLGVLEA